MADWGYEKGHFEPGESPVLLLVEDEMIIAFDIADQMMSAGFQVDGPYPSNVKALAALDTGKPHVAILDVQLADGDVYPVATRLRELNIPIVFHSGHADPGQLNLEYPDAIVCTKPCSSGRLEDAVRSVMTATA
ncbi:response regulator [Croceicoccus bisphenolivorans]|uniref:response regulator n=1 Tax=Croceicoccus bisphenolivorans TaxID=1783232 RepID=UPI0008379872|nr:response regulator [Croceicoccus bisphenolivorans]